MKPTKIRMSDACEVAFQGFALDVQDNGAGLWDDVQDAEATRTLLMWAGWLGEGGEVLEGVPFPDALLVPADASAEEIKRVAALVCDAADVEGMYAEEAEEGRVHNAPCPESAKFARKASDALYRLAGLLSGLNTKRDKEAQAKARKARFAKARRVVWTHYTGSTITYLVAGWRECGCGAKVAELVEDAARPYVSLRCARTGGWVGAVLNEGDLQGEVLSAKACDADPDTEWAALLAGVA